MAMPMVDNCHESDLRRMVFNDYAIVWICASPQQYEAALHMLDRTHPSPPQPPGDTNTYRLGSVGNHNVLITLLDTSNPSKSVEVMVASFRCLKWAILLGKGTAVSPRVGLGDIVVGVPGGSHPGVIRWDRDTIDADHKPIAKDALSNPPSSLRAALLELESDHQEGITSIPAYLYRLGYGWPTQPFHLNSSHDPRHRRLQSDCGCQTCFKGRLPGRVRDICIHYGLIASGGHSVENAVGRQQLNGTLGNDVLCMETEAEGIMDNLPCLVVRGICLSSEVQQDDAWQRHAALVAAGFARELSERTPTSQLLQGATLYEHLQRVEPDTTAMSRDERNWILTWLTPFDYFPTHHDLVQRRHDRSGRWLSLSQKFLAWANQNGRTLFCPGPAGSGKSVALAVIIQDLLRTSTKSGHIGVCFAFCTSSMRNIQTTDHFLRNFIKQLAAPLSKFPQSLAALYKRHRTALTMPSLKELMTVLEDIVARYQRTMFIIDGIDECQLCPSDEGDILDLLFNLQEQFEINILASSRPYENIAGRFRPTDHLEIRSDEKDVKNYLLWRLTTVSPYVSNNEELRTKTVERIWTASQGIFLLAVLYLETIRYKASPESLEADLVDIEARSLRGSIDTKQLLRDGCDLVMTRINEGGHSDAKRHIPWLLYGTDEVMTPQFRQALALSKWERSIETADFLKRGQFVWLFKEMIAANEPIGIINYIQDAARGYFELARRNWLKEGPEYILRICLSYLSFPALQRPCRTENALQARLRTFKLFAHAVRNWAFYAKAAPPISEVLEFLQEDTRVQASCEILESDHGLRNTTPKSRWAGSGLHLAAYFGLTRALSPLISSKRYVDILDNMGRTPLFWAVKGGYQDSVELLLREGANPSTRDIFGQTPVSLAARHGHNEIIQVLLETGEKLSIQMIPRRSSRAPAVIYDPVATESALAQASEHGHDITVESLLRHGASPIDQDLQGRTPLTLAIGRGCEKTARLLLGCRAFVDARRPGDGRTPLSMAAEAQSVTLVRLLLDNGANVNSRCVKGWTPLFYAISNSQRCRSKLPQVDEGVAVVDKLLDRGADIYAQSADGESALTIAIRHNASSDVIRRLLYNGVDANARNNNGDTAMLIACSSVCRIDYAILDLLDFQVNTHVKDMQGLTPLARAVACKKDASLVRCLIEIGPSIHEVDLGCLSPSFWERVSDYPFVVEQMLQNPDTVHATDCVGRTWLSYAACHPQQSNMVQLLLDKGASVEGGPLGKLTPLQHAVGQCNRPGVEVLLRAGANAGVLDADNYTPLMEAVRQGDPPLIQLLLHCGPPPDEESIRTFVAVKTIYHLRSQRLDMAEVRGWKLTLPLDIGEGCSEETHDLRGRFEFIELLFAWYSELRSKCDPRRHTEGCACGLQVPTSLLLGWEYTKNVVMDPRS